ncbi:MAG: hypothetical protein OEZ39_17050 [Gammaproteobacteria bacterium]|nr:hypothetical protein [Gammaproteobacteria bacterium]MDH5653570.1 hypothetical protein [Gammaproteobacteria bacterium]
MTIFTDKDHSAAGILDNPSNTKATIITRGLLNVLLKIFLKPDLNTDDLHLPKVIQLLQANMGEEFSNMGETLAAELAHKIYSVEIVANPPAVGTLLHGKNDTEHYSHHLNGIKAWMPVGKLTSRQIGNHVITLVENPQSLSGSIQASDSLDLVAMTPYGAMGLQSSRGNGCVACSGCSGCALCVICAEVNVDAAAASAVGLAGLAGISG